MKKFRYILSALTLLVASATAHAQVFDVTITPTDGSEVFTKTSATLIEIEPGAASPISVFSGGADTEGESLTVTHAVRYDIALTPVNTINQGNDDDLPEDDFAAQAPKRKAAEAPSFTEPELTGPALVIMLEDGDPIIYYADAGTITLKCNANGEYEVGGTKVQGTVTNVFYKDAHSFQAVEDENGNATWTWAEDFSTATLKVSCTHNECSVNDSQTVTPTSEVTTLPTTEAEGVLTYTAKVTYNEVEYVSTTTATIDKLPAEDQAVTADVTLANNSVTVINASNAVAEGTSAPTITVTAGTAEAPTTANIIITGENTEAKVNVSVPANAAVNIYGNDNAKMSGNVETTGGKVNITGGTINGSVTASGGTLNISGAKVDGTITASAGAAVTLSNTNVTSTTSAAITVTDGGTLVLGKGTFTGKEGEGAFAYSDVANITPKPDLAFFFDGQNVGFATRPLTGAPARRTSAQVYKSLYDSYTVCDATHTDANFTGQKTFMGLNSTELKASEGSLYVCNDGCGTTSATPTYTRTMSNEWGTIVLPFDVTINSESQNFDFYTVSSVSSSELQLTKIAPAEGETSTTLTAGTPALIRMSEAAKDSETGKYNLSLTAPSNSVSTAITNPAAVNGLTLTGTYAEAEVTEGYIIANNAFWNAATLKGNDDLWKDNNGNTIASDDRHVYCSPFRAYLAGSSASGAPARLTIGTDEEEVSSLEALEAITEGEVEYYDLAGHRLPELRNGVNIVRCGGRSYRVIVNGPRADMRR